MAEEEALRSNEESALDNNQIVSSVVGKKSNKKKTKIKKGLGAAIFITLLLLLFLVFFSSGNLIPAAISERLIEVTDVQYADAVQSKELVFQQAMYQGEIPDNTAQRLEENGVEVGYLVSGVFVKGNRNMGEVAATGEFVQSNEANGELVLRMGDRIITAGEFYSEVNSNAKLYDAFNGATYSRAAYYYDGGAQDAFKRMGISRNNFSNNKSFEETMNSLMGEGNNIKIENSGTRDGSAEQDKNNPSCYQVEGSDGSIKLQCDEQYGSISSESAADLVSSVGRQNKYWDGTTATLNAADTLAVADSISKEQRSTIFYSAIMENISKMKAGYGNDSQINDAMNYLYREEETTVVDVNTGQTKVVKGSMLQSPSLYSVLSGEKMDAGNAADYSSERILKTVENQVGSGNASTTVSTTAASASKTGATGSIGRWMFGLSSASNDKLSTVTETVSSSLMENSFENIRGIAGGEMLVEGAVNVGAALALESGATVGDGEAVKKYARLNADILALDAEVDRMKRSPFDVTSKNTFLGSIMYKFAVSTIKSGTFLNKMASFSKVTASSMMSLFPMANADDEDISYMTATGNCEHLNSIGAVGTASCARNETFDVSTLYSGVLNDNSEYNAVVKNNVTCDENNVCRINEDSDFEKFAKYNVQRTTPVGVSDSAIINEETGNESGSMFLALFKLIFGGEETKRAKRMASGEEFVNASSNSNWNTYKYAQRYFSVVRATDALRQYDGDKTAYSNIPFVGVDNPVIACLEKLEREEKAIAAND